MWLRRWGEGGESEGVCRCVRGAISAVVCWCGCDGVGLVVAVNTSVTASVYSRACLWVGMEVQGCVCAYAGRCASMGSGVVATRESSEQALAVGAAGAALVVHHTCARKQR